MDEFQILDGNSYNYWLITIVTVYGPE
uniref:Uncharacterized protein n=1 Tax=Anguilla anguilla TaxID=7936 RepID=A0A0E9Q0R8_ANGAN